MAAEFDKENGVVTGLEGWDKNKCKVCPVNYYKRGLCHGKGSTLNSLSDNAFVETVLRGQDEIEKVGKDGLCFKS